MWVTEGASMISWGLRQNWNTMGMERWTENKRPNKSKSENLRKNNKGHKTHMQDDLILGQWTKERIYKDLCMKSNCKATDM